MRIVLQQRSFTEAVFRHLPIVITRVTHLLEHGRRAAVEVVVRPELAGQLDVGLPEAALLVAGVHEEHGVLRAERTHGGRVGQRRDDGRAHPRRVLDNVLPLPVPLVRVLELRAADTDGTAGRGEVSGHSQYSGEGSVWGYNSTAGRGR